MVFISFFGWGVRFGGFRGRANDGSRANPDMEDEWVGEKERKSELFNVRF